MKYSERIKFIKEHAEDEIIITQAGNFYIAVGRDAVFLSKLLELKCTCFAKGMCKVGFPTKSLDKYVEKLIESGYSFLIYDVNSDGEFELRKINMTHKKFNERAYNLGCGNCEKNKNTSKKEKENLNAIIIDLEKYKEKLKNERK